MRKSDMQNSCLHIFMDQPFKCQPMVIEQSGIKDNMQDHFLILSYFVISVTSTMHISSVPRVWIIGSSLIARLEKHIIATRPPEFTLGLQCQIRWMGRGGMRWEHLLPLLRRTEGPSPDVMVIHLAGNNLGSQSGCSLMQHMREDLEWIISTYPKTKLMFSNIVQRRVYRDQSARSSYGLERTRRLINSGIAAFLRDRGLGGISHSNIRHNLDYYLKDGVHLNHRGNEVFLQNFHVGLSTACCPVRVNQSTYTC